jgi:DNA invertase Pin-like site-specific DNA recombinase
MLKGATIRSRATINEQSLEIAAAAPGSSTAVVRNFVTGIKSKAQRMHASGESASTIAATMGVSRATVYLVLAERAESSD